MSDFLSTCRFCRAAFRFRCSGQRNRKRRRQSEGPRSGSGRERQPQDRVGRGRVARPPATRGRVRRAVDRGADEGQAGELEGLVGREGDVTNDAARARDEEVDLGAVAALTLDDGVLRGGEVLLEPGFGSGGRPEGESFGA